MGLMLRSFVTSGAIAAGLVATGCVDLVSAVGGQLVDKEEKRFSVSGTPDVTVKTFDGSIEIRGWDRPEVLVVIEKYGLNKDDTARIQVTAGQRDNNIIVEAAFPPGTSRLFRWHGSAHVKLIVSLPKASNVTARSGDGSLNIEQVTGVVNLQSGDGSIRGRDVSGSVKAHTGDGSISLDVDGVADLHTGDGSIRLEGRLDSVRVKTGDGSVAVRAAPGSTAEDDWDIQSGDGSVKLELGEGFGGVLDARTNDGHIRLDGVEVSDVTGEINRGSLHGTVGAGGRAVRLHTGDGSITIRKF